MTLLVFRPGKRGLKFDLVAIPVIQVAALLYGVRIVYLAHPAYLVFVKDRFEVATPVELAPAELAQARFPQFARPPWGPPRLAVAEFPSDPQERSRLAELALAGFDLQSFPKYWVPYETQAGAVLAKAQTVEQLRAADAAIARVVDAYLQESATAPASVMSACARGTRGSPCWSTRAPRRR